jgi:hypothetical protein
LSCVAAIATAKANTVEAFAFRATATRITDVNLLTAHKPAMELFRGTRINVPNFK